MDVVVWNNDARYKPDLEVEIELIELAAVVDEPWLVADDEVVALDDYTVYDEPPRGYADAYAMAI